MQRIVLSTGEDLDDETRQDTHRYASAIINAFCVDAREDAHGADAHNATEQLVRSAAGLYRYLHVAKQMLIAIGRQPERPSVLELARMFPDDLHQLYDEYFSRVLRGVEPVVRHGVVQLLQVTRHCMPLPVAGALVWLYPAGCLEHNPIVVSERCFLFFILPNVPDLTITSVTGVRALVFSLTAWHRWQACIRTYIHACTDAHLLVGMGTYTHTSTHARTCAHIHTPTNIEMDTYLCYLHYVHRYRCASVQTYIQHIRRCI